MRSIGFCLLLLMTTVPACAQTVARQPPSSKPVFQGAAVVVSIGDPRKGEASYIVVADQSGRSRSFRVNTKVSIIDNQRHRLQLRQVRRGARVIVQYRPRKRGRPQALTIWVLSFVPHEPEASAQPVLQPGENEA